MQTIIETLKGLPQGSLFLLFLSLAAGFALAMVFRRDADSKSKIDLDDLLLGDDGKISKITVAFFVCLALTTWVIVYLTSTAALTEGYYIAYLGAWVTPIVAKIVFNKQPEIKKEEEDA